MRWTMLAALTLLPTRAWAHHVIGESGVTPVVPATLVGMDASAATYDLGAAEGSWQATVPFVEVALGRRFSAHGALPVAHVRPEAGDTATGIGDASVGLKAAVWQDEHGESVLSVGFGLELPTGDHDTGLGGGHWGLVPFVAASTSFLDERLIVYGITSGSFAVGGDHHHEAALSGSVVSPHAESELHLRAMAAWAPGWWHVAAGTEAVPVAAHDARWVAARTEVGIHLQDRWRIVAGADAGLWGQARYGVRGRLGLARRF